MIDKMGNIKIADFGIAQATERTVEMGFFGTPSYMSPEQLKDEVVGNESDIFSLGCVLYELLTGKRAFSGDKVFAIIYKIINEEPVPITDLRPDLPEILEKITKRALSKARQERYQTCMDFAYDLRVALRGLTGTLDKIKDVGDYIHSVPFFHNFTKKQVRELISACTIVKVRKGKVIVAQGEIDDTFYVILSGKANVMKDDQKIASISTGQCFGEMSFIGGQARIASVFADTDCALLKISATLLDRSPESIQLLFYRSFATTLVRRMSV
jgi:serine/threonine-protein kinase